MNKGNTKIKSEDITGIKFGSWTVLGRANKGSRLKRIELKWHCLCDCGSKKEVYGKHLRSGRSKNCRNCQKEKQIKDLTGKVFGALTVIERFGREKSKNKAITWKCTCKCGESAIIRGSSLVGGGQSTCGCGRGGVGQWMNKINFGKRFYYNNIYYKSRYEVIVALFLDKCEEKYDYEPKKFNMIIDDIKTTYTPDFKLSNRNLWIEVKGDKSNLKKFNQFTEDKILISSSEISTILNQKVANFYYYWKKNGYSLEFLNNHIECQPKLNFNNFINSIMHN
jgi:hypothetical protein